MAQPNKIAGITVARQQQIDVASDPSRGKWSSPFRLRSGNLAVGLMRVNKDGGENNLHTHTGDDAFWYVVSGAVKFYGEGDKLIGEYQKGEGILIPRGFKYWFESGSKDPLEILRVTAKDQMVDNKRVDLSPQKDWMIQQNTFGARH